MFTVIMSGTFKSLRNSLSFVTNLLQDSNQEISKIPVKKVQHSCQDTPSNEQHDRELALSL